jgi:hypothetical protein
MFFYYVCLYLLKSLFNEINLIILGFFSYNNDFIIIQEKVCASWISVSDLLELRKSEFSKIDNRNIYILLKS